MVGKIQARANSTWSWTFENWERWESVSLNSVCLISTQSSRLLSKHTSSLQCTGCASLVVTWIGCGTHLLNFQISKDRQPWQKSDPLSIATLTRLQIGKKTSPTRHFCFCQGKKKGHCALNAIRFTATGMITTHRRQSSKAKNISLHKNLLIANRNTQWSHTVSPESCVAQ